MLINDHTGNVRMTSDSLNVRLGERRLVYGRVCRKQSDATGANADLFMVWEIPQAKPEWWTAAWDQLEGTQSMDGNFIQPVCSKVFKDECSLDVNAFDQPGCQSHTDSATGETILPDEGNDLLGGVIGVIWSDKHVTMTRCADRNNAPGMTFLRNFAELVKLCPEGRTLTFKTHSSELVEQYDRMVQRKERGYEGLDPSEVHEVWKRIIDQIELSQKRVQMCLGTVEEVPSYKSAVVTHVKEVVDHLEEVLELPVDPYTPLVPPWD
jgi:hypothetical protein